MRYLLAIAVLLASSAYGETTVGQLEPAGGTWRVYRGSTYVCTANSEAAALACAAANAETRRATTRYQIRYPNRYVTVTYTAPACGPKPADLTQTAQCPTGTTGTWLQVQTHITAPYPQCWTQSAWTPAEAPTDACTPIPPPDADGDGVPDDQDRCPSQPAATPDGCPIVEPPPGSIANLPVICVAAGVAEGATVRACPWEDQRFEPATPTTLVRNCAEASCTTVTGVWRRMGNVTGGTVEVCTLPKMPGAPVVGGDCPTSAGVWSGMQYVAPSQVARVEAPPPPPPPPPPTPGTATLSWIPPTTNVDGSPLTDLAGYLIAYGTERMTLHRVQRVEGAVLSAVVTGLAPGPWYFTVRVYTTTGVEGWQSNVASKVVQ